MSYCAVRKRLVSNCNDVGHSSHFEDLKRGQKMYDLKHQSLFSVQCDQFSIGLPNLVHQAMTIVLLEWSVKSLGNIDYDSNEPCGVSIQSIRFSEAKMINRADYRSRRGRWDLWSLLRRMLLTRWTNHDFDVSMKTAQLDTFSNFLYQSSNISSANRDIQSSPSHQGVAMSVFNESPTGIHAELKDELRNKVKE